ncbi:MAG: hypothetical protein K6G01_08960 [Eubacterium sp.]|nr:hypothetical protein [Eubacterium sp.]
MRNHMSRIVILGLALILTTIVFTACGQQEDELSVSSQEKTKLAVISDETTDVSSTAEQSSMSKKEPTSYKLAIEEYIIDKIGMFFDDSDICIPCMKIIATDKSDKSDIKAWGIYWIYNYKIEGDTLVCESGGSNPGLMHVVETDGVYQAKSFEIVSDGSKHDESAKKIFGEYYKKFIKASENEKANKKIREKAIVKYIKDNHLNVTKYRDEGADPVKLDL